MEADSSTEVADTPAEAQSLDQGETNLPTEIFPGVEHPKEGETQTDSSAPQTQTEADANTIAQAKEWHDSVVSRLARLRGLSCWLGDRNKRMDGMVEILVRSLEHMGVGAVTDHIGNLIPLQNFRLNSAIKLSTADNTWTTCDDETMSNDINAWLPGSLPDDHNLPLTNEQMGKYESQVEVLRAENEALQRSLQTALDNQGSLGVQINQWQACIDSAGQQLCQVTQEVHDSKSRERHLRHLLGEERRIKDSLVQQNSLTKADQDHATENVNCWPPNINEGISGPSQSTNSAPGENSATCLQGLAGSPGTEMPWQQTQGISSGPRDTHSSRLNSSAPPFISAYSSPHRQNYRSNWHARSDWHPRSGSGRTFGSGTGRGRHGSGRGHYRKEHSTNVGFNRLLDGFFDNLNRIENALRQQGINVPGPTSDAAQVVQQQQQQQVVCSNVNVQYPTVNDLQQQQQQETAAPNQPIYYSPPMQPVVYPGPMNVVAHPVQSIPSVQQVPHQSPMVVQAIPQPHVQFAQVEGQAY
ncbi:uncharacterized protein LOC100888828 [Strongylocentrotus purpuratus]|uniref:Uncharacterized protein n=1 Tax=Strongylocentrotus purpuratus TaxID=7668 RepID=A0A7M7SXC3_STRPU|nr:uncharacterized protein LOC100888828 [Strongylocentrotus purpuratus]